MITWGVWKPIRSWYRSPPRIPPTNGAMTGTQLHVLCLNFTILILRISLEDPLNMNEWVEFSQNEQFVHEIEQSMKVHFRYSIDTISLSLSLCLCPNSSLMCAVPCLSVVGYFPHVLWRRLCARAHGFFLWHSTPFSLTLLTLSANFVLNDAPLFRIKWAVKFLTRRGSDRKQSEDWKRRGSQTNENTGVWTHTQNARLIRYELKAKLTRKLRRHIPRWEWRDGVRGHERDCRDSRHCRRRQFRFRRKWHQSASFVSGEMAERLGSGTKTGWTQDG